VSATARLAIVSRHRLPLAVDGVLLMAETRRRCLRCRRTNLRRPRPSDITIQRAGRWFFLQSGTIGKSAGV